MTLPEVYNEIAMERPHECTGCGTHRRLSHSHLVPKSADQSLKCEKKNITYHCMSMGEEIGCHNLWESVEFWKLKDAYKNMEYVFSVRPDIFWLKINRALSVYTNRIEVLNYSDEITSLKNKKMAEYSKAIKELVNIKSIADDKKS